MKHNILFVDDEKDIRNLVKDALSKKYQVFIAADASEAIELLKKHRFSVMIADVWIEGSVLDGLGLLQYANEHHPGVPTIMISGHATIEIAVNALKMGAKDYIEKPLLSIDKFISVIQNVIDLRKLQNENSHLRKKDFLHTTMDGESPVINNVRANITKLSLTNSRVFIHGERGSGKDLAARLIFKNSSRAKELFVTYKCILSQKRNILHSLLGNGSDIGLLERSSKGVLYLDEVTNLTMESQKILLLLLQESEIKHGEFVVKAKLLNNLDVRIISSSSCDIGSLVKQGKFLQTLYNRLNVVTLNVPSLRQYKEDIPLLSERIIKKICMSDGIKNKTFDSNFIYNMQLYNWPGNVQELKLVLARSILNSRSDVLTSEDLALYNDMSGNTTGDNDQESSYDNYLASMPLRKARRFFEIKYLTIQMLRFNHSISQVAKFIGMERSALHRKIRSLGIE